MLILGQLKEFPSFNLLVLGEIHKTTRSLLYVSQEVRWDFGPFGAEVKKVVERDLMATVAVG